MRTAASGNSAVHPSWMKGSSNSSDISPVSLSKTSVLPITPHFSSLDFDSQKNRDIHIEANRT